MKRIFLILFALCSVMSGTQARPDSVAVEKLIRFAKKIQDFNHLYPQEKVYLHFDNTGYFQGETIWFKAYIVSAENLHLSELSKILYVELLTQEGECVETLKLKIENGQCHGDFKLDTQYRSGFYEIRAYTRAMLNFGDDVIFSRVFPIYKEPKEDGNYKKDMSEPYSRSLENKRTKQDRRQTVNVDFYPEGGNLIRGLINRVAFRVTGKNGENLDVQGKLYGPDKQEITDFSTLHQGMGIFSLLPENKKYKVAFSYKNNDYDFELPVALLSGYTMSLNNLVDNALIVGIRKTPDLPASTLGLSVTCRGKPYLFDTLRVENGTWEQAIPKRAFPEGVNCITLFNDRGEILSERLFFVSRPPEVTLTCQQDKERYRPQEKIRLDFSASDRDGQPVETTFSLSVRDAFSSSIIANESNIQNNLLLSSDLKGYIEQPDYYFESDDNVHKQALDLLMMTQGWRRYVWRQMAGIEPLEIKHPIEESLMIKGRALNLYSSKPMSEVQLAYFLTREQEEEQEQEEEYNKEIPQSKIRLIYHQPAESSPGESGEAKTNKDGRFVFLLPDTLTGKWDLTLQTFKTGKLLKSRILLDRIFSPKKKAYSGYEMQDSGTLAVFDEESEIEETRRSIHEVQVLKEVKIKAPRSQKIYPSEIYHVDKEINEKMDIGKSYPASIAGYLIDKDNNFEWHKEEHHNSTKESMLVYEKIYNNKGAKFKNVIVYPFYVRDKNIIMNLEDSAMLKRKLMKVHFHLNNDIETVERISVYRNADVLSRNLTNKFVFVECQLKKDKKYANIPGTRLTYFEGYSYIREFARTVSKEPEPGDIDYRRTLYWNPNVETDEQGKTSILFYNNTSCRKINISAAGIAKEGIVSIK